MNTTPIKATSIIRGRSGPELDKLQARRLQAAELFRQGQGPSAVARQLGVCRQTVSGWHSAWLKEGKAALKSQRPVGRPGRLDDKQKRELRRAIVRGPLKEGWKTDLWTLPRIAQLIAKRFGVSYAPGHVWRVVRELGLTPQRPQRVAKEADPAAVATWLEHDWPAIKKKPENGGKRWS